MAVNASNVLVGAPDQQTTGAILSAILGTELPTAPGDQLAPEFLSSGYVSENGVTLTPERSTTGIKDWSGSIVRNVLEEFNGTLAWEHLETNEESLRNYFGDDNVEISPATLESGEIITAALGAYELPRKSWVFKIKDGTKRVLIKVPDGQVTEQGEVSFTKTGAILWPVTLTTYPDASGNNIYVITDDGVFAASAPPAAWEASTAYTLGERVTLSGGEVLEATTAGTSGASEPTAPATVGGTVTDGTVEWTRES